MKALFPQSLRLSLSPGSRAPGHFSPLLVPLFAMLLALFCPSNSRAQQPTPAEMEKAFSLVARYESGQSLASLRQVESWVGQSASEPQVRRLLENHLARLLQPGSPIEVQKFACVQLGIIGTEASLPAIAPLLRDPQTAGLACLALSTFPPGKADALLRAQLDQASGTAKIQILSTLGDRRDAKAVPQVAAIAAKPDDSAVRAAAIAALGKIGDQEAWKSLEAILQQAPSAHAPVLIEAALRCAAHLAATEDRKPARFIYESLLAPGMPLYARRSAFSALIKLDKDGGEARVLETLKAGDDALKPVAIFAVRTLPAEITAERMAGVMPLLSTDQKARMIESLAARHEVAVLAVIAHFLAAPELEVRLASINALGRIGDASTVPLLVRAFGATPTPTEPRALEQALVAFRGGEQTDAALLRELKSASAEARPQLVTAFSTRAGSRATPFLLELADSPDAGTTLAAWRALGQTAQPADVPTILARLNAPRATQVRAEAETAASRALARIENPEARSTLVCQSLAQASTPEARASFIGLLPLCGTARALQALEASSSDPNPDVSEARLRALADWPTLAGFEPLFALWRQTNEPRLQTVALRGLARLAGEAEANSAAASIERYRRLFAGARSVADEKLLLGVLGTAQQPEALALALSLLDKPAVRAEAGVAVRKIAETVKTTNPDAARAALAKLAEPLQGNSNRSR